jgi:hypothetical protein
MRTKIADAHLCKTQQNPTGMKKNKVKLKRGKGNTKGLKQV